MNSDRWGALQILGRTVKWAQLGSLGPKWGYGTIQGPPIDPQGGEEDQAQPVRLMGWFGFRSAPVASGGEAIVVSPRGGTSNATVIATENLSLGPRDLKEGEVAVFDKAGSVVRLYEDGTIRIIGKSGTPIVITPSGDVRLGTDDPAKLSHAACYEALKTDFDALASKFNAFVTAYNAHLHGSPAGATTVPTAVYSGSATPLSSAVASPNVYVKDRL